MPLPLIAAAAVVAVRVVLVAVVTHPMLFIDLIAHRDDLSLDAFLNEMGREELMQAFSDVICDYAEARAGLVLDRADPLSDESLTAAVGGRIGIELTTLRSVESLKADVARFAQDEIEARSGVALTNIMDTEAIRADVGSFASVKVSAYVGVPISDVLDFDRTKEELTNWAVDKFVDYVKDKLTETANGVGGVPVDLSGVGEDTKQGLKDGLSASEVLSQAFAGVVTVMLDKARRDLQRTRRKEQNRQAQSRFRARHGCRMRYERL